MPCSNEIDDNNQDKVNFKACEQVIELEYVEDFFKDKAKIQPKLIGPKPRIGLVNGLFATASGMGGITIIEAFKSPNDTKLALTITGQQGDVMKESITCAKTIAWNLLPESVKNDILVNIKEEKHSHLEFIFTVLKRQHQKMDHLLVRRLLLLLYHFYLIFQ